MGHKIHELTRELKSLDEMFTTVQAMGIIGSQNCKPEIKTARVRIPLQIRRIKICDELFVTAVKAGVRER